MSDENESADLPGSHWYGDAGRFFQSVFRIFSRNAMPTIGAATLVAILVARSRRTHQDPDTQRTPTTDRADSPTTAAN